MKIEGRGRSRVDMFRHQEEIGMRAFELTGPNRGLYVTVAQPPPKDDELLIRGHRVGLSGTGVEILRGTMTYFKLGWAKGQRPDHPRTRMADN